MKMLIVVRRDRWLRGLTGLAVFGLILSHFVGPWWTELEYAMNSRAPFDTTMMKAVEFLDRVPASDVIDQRINALRLGVGFGALALLLLASKFQMRACLLFWLLNFEIPYALAFVGWGIDLDWHWPSGLWNASFIALPALLIGWQVLNSKRAGSVP